MIYINHQFIQVLGEKSAITQLIWMRILSQPKRWGSGSIKKLALHLKTSESTTYRALVWGAPLALRHGMLALGVVKRTNYNFIMVEMPSAFQARETTPEIEKNIETTARNLLQAFNKVCGTEFSAKPLNIDPIKARLLEKHTPETMLAVAQYKNDQWTGTENMKWLRPVTIFGDKFENYLHEYKSSRQNNGKPETEYNFS